MAAGNGKSSPRSLAQLARAIDACRGCDLWRDATQAVAGDGPARTSLMLVGEQPGDREDIEGEPFVGPAGRVLAEALEGAGIERSEVFVTNAVKHFKWRQGRGKRRLHQRPNIEEVKACRPWLVAEVELVKPRVIVCLGATAARSVLGPGYRVTRDRGQFVETDLGPLATGTIHPSAILRIREREERRLARAELERDLAGAARKCDQLAAA
jgi:DNA polymerase